MTKIAIISQPEQGVLIDIGGCDSLNEATQHLSSTFQVTNEFWENQPVDLNLGKLRLGKEELAQIVAILTERGVNARQFLSEDEVTQASLREHAGLGSWGEPATAATTSSAELIPEPPAAEPSSEIPSEEKTEETAKEAGSEASVGATSEAGSGEPSDAKATLARTPEAPKPHVLYLRQTLRSGQSVSHKGHLVIVGDVNPGAEVSAEGDITIWGALRGIAHAGTAGNTNCEIRALKFDPIQLRIAQAIARAPDRPRGALRSTGPETARIVNGTIRISSSAPE